MYRRFLPFIISYLVLFCLMTTLLLCCTKVQSHLLLNSFHSPSLDFFFRWFSYLAEWPIFVLAVIPVFFKKWRWTAFYAISELCGIIIIQSIKFSYFTLRPWTYFQQYTDISLPLVEGVHLHRSASFPSGHTSTFFIFFTYIALLLVCLSIQKRGKKDCPYFLEKGFAFSALLIALLILASLGSFSRIYLSQHFLIDVCFGSVVGVLIPCVIYSLYAKKIVQ